MSKMDGFESKLGLLRLVLHGVEFLFSLHYYYKSDFLRVYGCFVDWIVKLIGWNYATRFNGRYHFMLVDFFSWPLEDLIIWNYYFMGIDNFWILMALLLIQIFGMISWSYMLIVNLSVLVKILNLWLPTQGFWFSVGCELDSSWSDWEVQILCVCIFVF